MDVDEASAILQLIDETIQSMYEQLEGEVEAGQSVLSKMPELIIAYEKLEEEKDRTKTETELVKESYQLTAGEIGRQHAFEKQLETIGRLLEQAREKLDGEHVAYSLLIEEVEAIEKQMEEAQKEHAEYRENLQALRKEELQARETLMHLRKTISDTANAAKKQRAGNSRTSQGQARDGKSSYRRNRQPIGRAAAEHGGSRQTSGRSRKGG